MRTLPEKLVNLYNAIATRESTKQMNTNPYTIKQLLGNLQNCAWELKEHPANLEAGAGYVRGILESILARGIKPDATEVIVSVTGGNVQEVYCDTPVRVIVADFDNAKAGAEYLCSEADVEPVASAPDEIKSDGIVAAMINRHAMTGLS